MKRNWPRFAGAVALAVLAACSDDKPTGPAGQEAFTRYVAIGTSLTMGVQSDGVVYFSQQQDWTKLLAHQAFASYTQPLIAPPGCFSPLIAPLQFSRRLSGISATANPAASIPDTLCAAFGTYTLPTNDLGIDGANTYDALRVTPETASVDGLKRRRQYRLVLPPKTTQVTGMMRQNPTLVSVELGANEVLGVTTGLMAPAPAYRTPSTFVPNSVWEPVYAQVLDSVKKTGAKAILVGVPDVSNIVSFRTGDELWQNRAEFANFGVVINADCQANANLIFVPIKVATAVGTAQATATAFDLSCTDTPGAQDNILTPADVTTITAVVAGMNSFIQSQASANGWAYLDLNAVLGKAIANRGAYSVVKQLTCALPYGQFISMDGVHPNVQGYQEMANAAADALNATYGFAIPTNPQVVLTPAQICQ
ncbi:MAG TPA: SGNH/GDSL hydrolase family protein [Gemmatimonadaceae bacterium]